MVPGVFNHFDVLAAIIEPDAVVVMYHAVRYRVEPVFRDREKSVSKHKSRVWPPVFVSIPMGHKRTAIRSPSELPSLWSILWSCMARKTIV